MLNKCGFRSFYVCLFQGTYKENERVSQAGQLRPQFSHKGNDHIIDAVRCAMLVREQANLDQIGEETVSLKPVLTDPVFL